MIKIERFSYLNFANVREVDGIEFWELPDIPDIKSNKDRMLNVETNRIDILSKKAYNTYSLWWIIAKSNNIFFPPRDLSGIQRFPNMRAIGEKINK